MQTKCQALHAEHTQLHAANRKAMRELAETEFPVGTKVKYIYTYGSDMEPRYRTAEVIRHGDFTLTVRGATGGEHSKYAYELYPV